VGVGGSSPLYPTKQDAEASFLLAVVDLRFAQRQSGFKTKCKSFISGDNC